ncbi:MAG: tRNA lysidine(34) synthetase TilS [Firmicutes bacterium]|nr:tRNA lysidine(34) synthetase TilS [Bacillota bacterium]
MHGGGLKVPELDILPDVVKTIKRHNMLHSSFGVVVGVSGGIDSTALLHVLWRLKQEWDLKLYIAHLDHCIRGEEATQDARLVEAMGNKLELPVFVETIDIPARARAAGLTEEEAGRIARYQLYERLADQVNADRIAVGHHGDDQAETVLMNLIRGAGLRGLSGIPPVRGKVIRPLIELEKWRLEAYCQWSGLSWREDVTNFDTTYRRNYVRWEVIPRLKQLNPAIIQGLMRTSAILSEDWQLLEQLSLEAYDQALIEESPDGVTLDLPTLLSLPTALRKRVIDHSYCQVSGEDQGLAAASLEHIERLITGETPTRRWTLPGNVDVKLHDQVLILALRVRIKKEKGLSPCILPLGSSTIIEDVNTLIHTEILTGISAWWEEEIQLEPQRAWREQGIWWADMDLASLELPLYVRSRRPGDRFQPLGMTGTKKLQDLFVDAKVPRSQRDEIPCILDSKGILAVVGLHQAHRSRITQETEQVLRITVEQARRS